VRGERREGAADLQEKQENSFGHWVQLFFRSHMVLDAEAEIKQQENSGVLIKITKPMEIIITKFPEKKREKPTENTLKISENTEVSPEISKMLAATSKQKTIAPADGNLSLDQMWIISSLVGQYLNPKNNR
jgi:hypothetical protein